VSRLLGEGGTPEVVEGAAAPDGTFEAFKHEAERSFLAAKLREHDWNVSETARALKMPRSNLYKKIERYGLSRDTP
jgi:two-component system, NtrC family, nitrogen regulation response regulator NtrX